MIQKERRAGTTVPVVIRTHQARERNLTRALGADRPPRGGAWQPVCIRIEEQLGVTTSAARGAA